MSEPFEAVTPGRGSTLLRSALLMGCLAAILVGAYGLVLPTGWAERPLWILVATAGGLVLVMGLKSRRSTGRIRSVGDVALVFGIASMVLSVGAAMLIACAITLNITEDQASRLSVIHRMTQPSALIQILVFAMPGALSGCLGLWIARRREPSSSRGHMTGAARRFSTIGLAVACLIAAAVGAAAFYRWLTWG